MTVFLLSSVFIKDTRNMNKKKATDRLQEKLEQIKSRKPFTMRKALCLFVRTRKEKMMMDKGIKRIDKQLEVD